VSPATTAGKRIAHDMGSTSASGTELPESHLSIKYI
jgi:hypothetical protein